MRWFKFLALLVLLLAAVPEGVNAQGPRPSTGLAPLSWASFSPASWEEVYDQNGHHWLADWNVSYCYDQHYTPGDWQTCESGYGCISSWTWWLNNPSKLGVPETWRSIWPGAQTLSNYIATCYFN